MKRRGNEQGGPAGRRRGASKAGENRPTRRPGAHAAGATSLASPSATDSGTRPEAWAWAAFALLLLALGSLVYLGTRPGGLAPIRVYELAPLVLPAAALLVLLFALGWSATHRPFRQRRRGLPFLCLVLVIGAPQFPLPYPTSRESTPSEVCFRLPVDGEWTVAWGGDDPARNPLARFSPDRRYGIALVLAPGRDRAGTLEKASLYPAFGATVRAPADGLVVRAVGDHPDAELPWRAGGNDFGNHLVIEVAPGEFLFLAHLSQGSLRVAAGDRVRAGDELARVGGSGRSELVPEPHLALHLQTTGEPHAGEAIPWSFCDYTADGVAIERGLPSGWLGRDRALLGQRVRNGRPEGR